MSVRAPVLRASRLGDASMRGFTLIEIVLATLLLSLGLAIAFASLHSANASVQRADLATARNEHLRAVQAFLYRILQSAQPMVLARDDAHQQVAWLQGRSDRVRFVAPMPGYMSHGGPYVVSLRIAPSASGRGNRLLFDWTMLVNEKPLASDDKHAPEELLDDIAQAHFEYRGLDADGNAGSWQTKWDRAAQLPIAIRLVLRFGDAAQPWPPFATSLPLGWAQAHPDDGNRFSAGFDP